MIDIRKYRQQELEKFFISEIDKLCAERENLILSKGVICRKVCVSADEYIRESNLHTYREVKKRIGPY